MDHGKLAILIESFLLTAKRWFSVTEICRTCSCPERLLRADGKRRPIYRKFAISSSTKGLKRLSFTNVAERIQYKHARLKVLISNRRALDDFAEASRNCLTGKFPRQEERFSRQATLFPL